MRAVRGRPAAEAALAFAALCGLAALAFVPVLGSEQAFLERDLLRVYLPAKLAWADAVRAGAWPGWYPYDAFGQPLAGLVVSGAYSPGNVLWLLFEPVTALKVAVLSSYPLAGLGAWLCFRGRGASAAASALGAGAWALCGPLVGAASNLA